MSEYRYHQSRPLEDGRLKKRPNLGGKRKKKEPKKEKVVRERSPGRFTKIAQVGALAIALVVVALIIVYKAASHRGWTPSEMWTEVSGKPARLSDFQCNVLLGRFRMADSAIRATALLPKKAPVPQDFLKYAEEVSANCGGYAERMGDLKLDLYREARHDRFISRH